MKTLAALSLIFLFHFPATAQFGIEAGYAYMIDQRIDKEDRYKDYDSVYKIHQFSFGVNRLTSKGWEFGLDVTGLVNRQQFYAMTSYYYLTGGFGPAKHTFETRFRADVSYAYMGARLSLEKWFGFKRASWLQIGVGAFQNTDFLISHSQTNTEKQLYEKHESSWGTTEQATEWYAEDFEALEMKKAFFYGGLSFAVRFRIGNYWIEPSVSGAYAGSSRSTNRYVQFESPYLMPAFCCKLGYRFAAKKPKE